MEWWCDQKDKFVKLLFLLQMKGAEGYGLLELFILKT